jgi:hypothetical protein
MDTKQTHEPYEEPKRDIKESVGIAPRDRSPPTRSPSILYNDKGRPRSTVISTDWHWAYDRHGQR